MANLKIDSIKTEVALEMISLYIGLALKENKKITNHLIKERDLIYQGNNILVDKVLNEYGDKIKQLLN